MKNPLSILAIINLTKKKSEMVMRMRMGKNFSPSDSLPFAMRPRTNEPMNEVTTSDVSV